MWVCLCLFFPSVTLSWTSEQVSWSSRRMPHLAPISSRSACPMECGQMLSLLSLCTWGSCETRPSTAQGLSAWQVGLTLQRCLCVWLKMASGVTCKRPPWCFSGCPLTPGGWPFTPPSFVLCWCSQMSVYQGPCCSTQRDPHSGRVWCYTPLQLLDYIITEFPYSVVTEIAELS